MSWVFELRWVLRFGAMRVELEGFWELVFRGVFSDLEEQWRCLGSSSTGSRRTGFWRYLRAFMVCFSGL